MMRILQVVSNMDRAGIETMLMNYYRHLDRNQVQFDFLCNKSKPGDYDKEILSLGGQIFHSPGLSPFKFFKYLRYMKQLFMEHPEYTIVHAHNDAFVVYAMIAAKLSGVPVRIAHVHNTFFQKDYKLPLRYICRPLIPFFSTDLWACGQKAGDFFFGDGANFHIHNNAIKIQRFIFDPQVRARIRENYGFGDSPVIGHVGRFDRQKNHHFIIEVFEQIHNLRHDAYMVLIGEGKEMDKIKRLVNSKGLSSSVLFLGSVGNVNEWYQAFDLFLLPSLAEGLPVVCIEAQTADLPCVLSDTITREVRILPSTVYMSLRTPASLWAEKCLSLISERKPRADRSDIIREAGYDVELEAEKLMNIYRQLNKSRIGGTAV